MSKIYQDFIIVRKDGENYIAFHLITLGQTGDFYRSKHYGIGCSGHSQTIGRFWTGTTAAENENRV